jgi:hypothetical protein
MVTFRKCPLCDEYGFSDQHACPPKWEARRDWDDDGDVTELYAIDAEEAAKKLMEDNFSDWSYPTAETILVRAAGQPWKAFNVTVEQVPSFSAREVPLPAKDEESVR